jgi:Mce-associated membrane protein
MRRSWSSWPVLTGLAVAVVLAAVGVGLLVMTPRHSATTNSNVAVIDTQATAEVVGQVDTALQRVLSYSYKSPQDTKAAAQQELVGAAAKQYEVLFTQLQKKAGTQQLTLSAKVVDAGVTSLDGSRAELLVFLDQSSTRASDGKTSTSAAQIQISAVRSGGSWRISELVPL